MAQKALHNGIIILNQKINGKNIEKEIFVRLTPCYNCYGYEHKTNECPKEKQTLCSYCSEAGYKHTECNKENPQCINCGGNHRTLAASCKVRKDLIKERSREVRARSRSRSQTRQNMQTTYANTAAEVTNNRQTQRQNDSAIGSVSKGETKEMITKIITSIAFAYYMEAITPGTFQKNIDEMFKINNLPRVNFPISIVTEGIKDMYRDTVAHKNKTETQVQPQTTENMLTTPRPKDTLEMETDSGKRTRESSEFVPTQTAEKRQKDDKPKEISRQTNKETTDYQLPTPLTSRPGRPTLSTSWAGGMEVGTGGTTYPEEHRGRDSTKPKTKATEKREPSHTRPKINVKDIGIIIYFKKSSRYIIDKNNQERREILHEAIMRGRLRYNGNTKMSHMKPSLMALQPNT